MKQARDTAGTFFPDSSASTRAQGVPIARGTTAGSVSAAGAPLREDARHPGAGALKEPTRRPQLYPNFRRRARDGRVHATVTGIVPADSDSGRTNISAGANNYPLRLLSASYTESRQRRQCKYYFASGPIVRGLGRSDLILYTHTRDRGVFQGTLRWC